MNTKRIFFWTAFIIILALIVWGLVVALNKPAVGSASGTPAPVTADDHVRGPADAPVTMIEYGDFQCPACEAYYPFVTRLLTDASTTMRLVFRHFPLPQHANAMAAAEASEAASVQGKFWPMYDALYTNQTEWSDVADPRALFQKYATQIGLNVPQFITDSASTTLQSKVQADEDEGTAIGIDSTPTFFVNGKAITNPQSYDDFKALIDAAATGGSY